MDAIVSTSRLGVGGNQPPGPIDFAHETMRDLSDWMGEHPVIETATDARDAKKLLDRAKGCAGDIEAERDKKVRPLNEKITEINSTYKAVHNTDSKKPGLLDKIVSELKARLTGFVVAEEARRIAEADRKRRDADEAERLSLEAACREREAIDNARAGELGVDVTQVVVEADTRAAQSAKAIREAARADRDTHVRVTGGWGKAVSLRTKETLKLDSYCKAITSIGPNDKIRDAILSAARDHRKAHGDLPNGVSAIYEREL